MTAKKKNNNEFSGNMRKELLNSKGRFVKGNPGKQKGMISKKTKLWHKLQDYICETGAQRFKKEFMKLKGKDFVDKYVTILEFFKPKLARTDMHAEIESKTLEDLMKEGKKRNGDYELPDKRA